jgi:hypothetical protein
MSRKKPKICHFGRHFIKVPQTVAWVTVNIAVWINFAGLGLGPGEPISSTARKGTSGSFRALESWYDWRVCLMGAE